MEHRKQPPFLDERPEAVQRASCYGTVELFIETLTGTCFELRVSLFDTLLSVKAKIQRLEGVPIGQQHLIWNGVELQNDKRLHHYSISDGCTLKLVLAMKGGPISTRKVPTGEMSLEAPDDVDAIQEDVWERSPPNKQLAFLVYCQGEQINLFGIVDRGDGMLTPVPELLSTGSVYNLYTEKAEEDGEIESPTAAQQTLENTVTMKKMKQLKAKMENMNLSRKTAKLRAHPPEGPSPCSSTFIPRLFPVLPQIGQLLPPAGGPPSTHASVAWECPFLGQTQTSSKMSQLEVDTSKLLKDRVFPERPILGSSPGEESKVQVIDDSVLMDPLALQQPEPLCLDSSAPSLANSTQTPSGAASLLPLLPGGVASTETQPIGAERCKLPPLHLPSEPIVPASRGAHLECIQGGPLQAVVIPGNGGQDFSEVTGQISLCPNQGATGSLLRKVSTVEAAQMSVPGCARGPCGVPSGPVRRTGALSCSLPPVKTPAAPKKKNSKHCSMCGKRTGLASSYECRCGNNFCASHRYPEAHGCSFDYKGMGRRVLQDSLPVVSAPKLPKI
ncbi:AN1-type zinc finger protein 4 [Paramormyrops kingsleyae]|uniref:AN1-type zinc finger protein 4 n=1 Tax=Paramormyrops kingsleyae TaxID=1676925 RepID=UPI003B9701BB